MKAKKIVLNTLFTIAFPVIMFFLMWAICAMKGKTYVGEILVLQSEQYVAISIIMALAIFSQFRNGRFDFSGGAILTVTSIVAGNVAYKYCNDSPFVFFVLCIVISVALCMLTCTVYCFSRVPIVIITIAMGLLYESLTVFLFSGKGLHITTSNINAFFGQGFVSSSKNADYFPGMYIPLILAVVIFVVFTYRTKWGKEAQMLANNQKVACNTGINEIKNVYATYIITGILLGLGAVVYASSKNVDACGTSLGTVGTLFSYIVPVFMGMYFGSKSRDYIGIIVSSIGLAFFSFGMDALKSTMTSAEGVTQLIMGCFTLFIYSLGSITTGVKSVIAKIKKKKEQKEGLAEC